MEFRIDFANVFVILFLAGAAFRFVLEELLELGAWRFRRRHGTEVPPALSGHIGAETLSRAVAYKNARYRLWLPRFALTAALDVALVLSCFYVRVYAALWAWCGNAYVTALLFAVLGSLPAVLVDLPFSLYREFGIEERFGFSTMTWRLWLLDEVKSLAVGAAVGAPLLCVVVALLLHTGGWWWLLLGCVYVAVSLVASFVYPVLIAPLFNTFTPLEEGELKDRLTALLGRTGFTAKSLLVMDASRRSAHSNAYFTGLGKAKRIVLYDTLIRQLSVDEIEAVLAHELGHYKRRHVVRRLLAVVPLLFLALALLSVLARLPDVYTGFGLDMGNSLGGLRQAVRLAVAGGADGPARIFISGDVLVPAQWQFLGICLLGISFGGFDLLLSLAANAASRHDEFQADAFSAELCGGGKDAPLCAALIKLDAENLMEVAVPKAYSLFNDGHPPLLERIAAIARLPGGRP